MIKFSLLRDHLLKNNYINEYNEILSFLKNPHFNLSQTTLDRLNDLGMSEFTNIVLSKYKLSIQDYRNEILHGQVIIWEEFLETYKTLQNVYERTSKIDIVHYEDNYLKATEQVYNILNVYAEAKAAITKLENNLGVDRYLDKIASDEFEFFVEKFDIIHKLMEQKLTKYKIIYTKKWNTTNVYDVVIHKLLEKNMKNQVCSLFQPRKQRILLFIIDGFGMGQYLWSKRVVPANTNFTYNENIFSWLSNEKLSDEFILGAPLITDTAAGISQIFIGKTAKETRIFSSTVKKEGSNKVVAVKSQTQNDFLEIVNIGYNSFTVDISAEKEFMNIYYCSRYDERNISGFSRYVFDSATVKSIIPPERVYSFLHDDLKSCREGATVIYITSVDNSGHVMGSFSQFERYEHEKINTMFKNFLIDLAKHNPEVFDGNTSVLMTADHGMTESYRINISRYDIESALDSVGETARIIEANRAMFLYGISQGGIQKSIEKLRMFFEERNIDVLILIKGEDLFDTFFPEEDTRFFNTTPDIAILLIGEGIFYSKDVGENLMHFGGHGGHSLDEVFVPFVNIELNSRLLNRIQARFLKLD